MKHRMAMAAIVLAVSLGTAGATEAKPPQQKPHPSPPAAAATAAAPESGAKVVQYGERDVIKLKTKVRFTTLIILPQNEQILDFTCGDKEFWQVNGNLNFAMVKPAKQGAMTNLNLITASGSIYTFILVEVSQLPDTEPDLKVFLQPKEESMGSARTKAPRFVPASDLDLYREQLQFARKETERIRKAANAAVDEEVAKFIENLNFSYKFAPDKKPFHAEAIYTDGKFTYIRARPEETPTLYEIRDGKPNLVNFEYKNGLFVAAKVIQRGYLAIGKDRLVFMRKEK